MKERVNRFLTFSRKRQCYSIRLCIVTIFGRAAPIMRAHAEDNRHLYLILHRIFQTKATILTSEAAWHEDVRTKSARVARLEDW